VIPARNGAGDRAIVLQGDRTDSLIFSQAPAAEMDATGVMPADSIRRIRKVGTPLGAFQVVFGNANATILATGRHGARL
jgi:hypothetical protein